MKYLVLILLLFITPTLANGQKKVRQIEIQPYLQLDWYPEFSYILGDRPSADYVKIRGTSLGVNIAYKNRITKKVFLNYGIGYYKYSFNKIRKENMMFGKSDVRNIIFVSPLYIPFFTDKYWYNTISGGIGVERLIKYSSNLHFIIDINLYNYLTFSQYYHLSNNPAGNLDFRKRNKEYFGTSVIVNGSLLKTYGKIRIGPSLILPAFNIWRTDNTFQEETNSGSRNKWFNGIGFGISCNYLFH